MDSNPIDDLPDQLNSVAVALAAASATILDVSRNRLLLPSYAQFIYLIRAARVTLQLYFSRDSSSTFFFFFRKKDTYIFLDARVDTKLIPKAGSTDEAGRLPGWMVGSARFILTDLSDADFHRFAPEGGTRDDTLVLTLDRDMTNLYAIQFVKHPRTRFSPGRQPGPVEEKHYALIPFLQLIEAIQIWTKEDLSSGTLRAPTNSVSAVHEIIDTLARGYQTVLTGLSKIPLPTLGPLEIPGYGVGDYSGILVLRLKENGELASKKEEEARSLTLSFGIVRAPDVTLVVTPSFPRISIDRGDQDPFFEALRDPIATRPLGQLLRLGALSTAQQQLVIAAFLDSARDTTTVLQLSRMTEKAVYLLSITGRLQGEQTTLIFAQQMMQHGESWEWDLEKDAVGIARYSESPVNTVIDDTAAGVFFSILGDIKRWRDDL